MSSKVRRLRLPLKLILWQVRESMRSDREAFERLEQVCNIKQWTRSLSTNQSATFSRCRPARNFNLCQNFLFFSFKFLKIIFFFTGLARILEEASFSPSSFSFQLEFKILSIFVSAMREFLVQGQLNFPKITERFFILRLAQFSQAHWKLKISSLSLWKSKFFSAWEHRTFKNRPKMFAPTCPRDY